MQKTLLGRELDRRYKVVHSLATGGFGQTYVAEDIRRPGNPRCVVKLLKPASIDDDFLENARRLFVTEAETLERLGSHDQIPRLLAYFEEAEDFYLVQEFIDGSVLTEELLPDRRWATVKVVKLMRDVLEILRFIHSQNVIHRDIKPDNIIRRRGDDNLVLVDFGTVKQIRTRVAVAGYATATISVGTPGYMPTEQSHGKPRRSSDIYALGIIAIQALTGLHPSQLQEDEDSGELIWQRWAACDRALVHIVEKMVRYHFRDRHRSASEVLYELNTYTQSSPELVRELATLQSSEKNARFVPQPTVVVAQKKVAPAKATVVIKDVDNQATDKASEQVKSQPIVTEIVLEKAVREQSPVLLPGDESPSDEPPSTVNEVKPLVESKVEVVESSPENGLGMASGAVEDTLHRAGRTGSAEILTDSSASSSKISVSDKLLLESIATDDVSSKDSNAEKLFSGLKPRRWNDNLIQQRWLKLSLTGIVATTAVTGGGWVFQSRKAWVKAEHSLIEAQTFQAERAYESCIISVESVPRRYVQLYETARELAGVCWLSQAETFAADQRLKDAIATAQKITPEMSAHSSAQKKIAEWTNGIFQIAINNYNVGKYESAKAIMLSIPEKSSLQASVKETLDSWETEWEKNNSVIAAAQKAIEEKKWQVTIDKVEKVTLSSKKPSESNPYWKEKIQPLLTQAKAGLETEAEQRRIAAAKAAPAAAAAAPTVSTPAATPQYSPPAQSRQNSPAPTRSVPAYSPPRYNPPAPARAPSGGGWNSEQR